MLFLASMGKTGQSHDIFFLISLRLFEVVEVEWWSMLNFEAATSKFCNCPWKFGSSPQKGKVDLCKTNGSKVLIYLTLLNFIFYCTLVSNAKGNLAESNKSELWNRLSYRGLPYLFEVRSQTVRNDCKISEVTASKFNLDFHSTSTTSKGLSENLKKMSWHNPVSPIDAKNSIFFCVCNFIRVSLDF